MAASPLSVEALRLSGGETALEVGTGSGYGAAVLARLAEMVYSIEYIEPLYEQARARLAAQAEQAVARPDVLIDQAGRVILTAPFNPRLNEALKIAEAEKARVEAAHEEESLALEHGPLPLPAAVLVVSGGHTSLYEVAVEGRPRTGTAGGNQCGRRRPRGVRDVGGPLRGRAEAARARHPGRPRRLWRLPGDHVGRKNPRLLRRQRKPQGRPGGGVLNTPLRV